MILGDDLNASTQLDAKQARQLTLSCFFNASKTFGLVDCQGDFHRLRGRACCVTGKSKLPWVNDYIFASESLEESIVKTVVIETPIILGLSDHNPVVVTFDL